MIYEEYAPFIGIDKRVFTDWKWKFFKRYRKEDVCYVEKGWMILFIVVGIRYTHKE